MVEESSLYAKRVKFQETMLRRDSVRDQRAEVLATLQRRVEGQTEEGQRVNEHAQDVAHQLNKCRKTRHARKHCTNRKALDATAIIGLG